MNTRHIALLVPLALAAGCDERTDAPLSTWVGSWQAAEPLFLDPAANAAYEAVHDLRPEYAVDEIRALFVESADVDYTVLRVEERTLRFSDGSTVVCAGEYASPGGASGLDGGFAPSPESYVDVTLTRELEGDCEPYSTVSLTALLPEGAEAHFHIVTSSPSGRLRPPPWNPSVWTTTTTAEYFAEGLEAAAPAIASSLPER